MLITKIYAKGPDEERIEVLIYNDGVNPTEQGDITVSVNGRSATVTDFDVEDEEE